ncbi:2-succinyl-6-hydroxy-2, 4-cyclohexadiene-1-carboxylate synthase [Rubrobacter xylanophilus DSM 9941]|uniref:alpha/beta fold hydrolase n=1 Tax=Rubrobacter xylanophilus TaxID=49319 RepID=UPI001C63D10A|nr:alpha/beta hydrolase [Rubrobacter xylanophilus]QYJ17163.1 2-succinyl-6-hydroxy-2, 4-cyclohexadiene-1-carboxylate synthase [Rubrobacter xylanophilus DSM 9941]
MDTETVSVPHLGGSRIGHRFGRPYDANLPTLVLINSFSTSVELYVPQFEDETLSEVANLLAIEPYGHGATRTLFEQFTYWDTAIAALQVLDAFDIREAFVLGTSQGGWIAARMAMLQPERIKGIIPLGTSMDYESERSRKLGCWDCAAVCTPLIDALSEPVGDDWTVDDDFCDFILSAGFGGPSSEEERRRWHRIEKTNYRGDEGRMRLRMCTINLRDRDGLHGRLDAVRCPVLWMHGTEDSVYTVPNAEEEITMFINSADAKLVVVDGGQHFLSASHPREVNAATAEFIRKWA